MASDRNNFPQIVQQFRNKATLPPQRKGEAHGISQGKSKRETNANANNSRQEDHYNLIV